MKIVQFKNNRFAVRKWVFFKYYFLDATTLDYWWSSDNKDIKQYASVATQEQAMALMERYQGNLKIDCGTRV